MTTFTEKLNELAKDGPIFKDTKADKEYVPGTDELKEGMISSPSAAVGAIDRMGGF